jgi:cytochrome P450 family 106
MRRRYGRAGSYCQLEPIEGHKVTQAGVEDISYDPFEDHSEIPFELLRDLRRSCPVAKVPSGLFYLARYDDVVPAFRHWKTFASAGGMRLPGVVIPPEEQIISERDGPPHQRLRRLMQSAISPEKVRAIAPWITELAGQHIDAAVAKGQSDLVEDLTGPVPDQVVIHLIGIPEPDRLQFKRWSFEVITSTWSTLNRTERGEGLVECFPDFTNCVFDQLRQRKESDNPPDDFLTRALNVDDNGYKLADIEICIAAIHLLFAGNETTTNLVGNLLYRLMELDLYGVVREDRSLLPKAIDESLRLDSPVEMLTRQCTRDVEVAGVALKPGDRVMLGVTSANRDESVFPDPDVFRLDRPESAAHLGFGKGAHVCLGETLARLEADIVFNAFFDRVERVRLAPGFKYQKLPIFWANGPVRLDVVFG